jgi:hypothetical protein
MGQKMKKTEKMNQEYETLRQFLMMISMMICSKMTLMTMMISSIFSTLFLNRMLIQTSSWMIKKKIQKKDHTNVALDEVHNYIF